MTKSMLENKDLYLSGAIEHDATALNWRVEPSKVFTQEFKIKVYDPFVDPKQQFTKQLYEARNNCDLQTMSDIAHGFVRKDLYKVDKSDMLVAYLPYKVPTCGTIHEIINANNAKKPVFLVCPQGKQFIPIWLFGFINTDFMFNSWEELYNFFREINALKHLNNNRLKCIYELI